MCEGFIVSELIARGMMRISWTRLLGSVKKRMRKLVVKARRRKCKVGYPESAHRLSERLVRNARVHMRRAEFWMASSRARWERAVRS